jgi:hypothetical protein
MELASVAVGFFMLRRMPTIHVDHAGRVVEQLDAAPVKTQ